jgi:hypothetical protein
MAYTELFGFDESGQNPISVLRFISRHWGVPFNRQSKTSVMFWRTTDRPSQRRCFCDPDQKKS